MTYDKSLKLTGRQGDSFVCYPFDDEDKALVVSIKHVLPNGEIALTFCGDQYKVWRGNTYERGQMRR